MSEEDLETKEMIESLGGYWGLIGFKIFDAFANLIRNLHWVIGGYFLYLSTYEISHSNGKNNIYVDVGTFNKQLRDIVGDLTVNIIITLLAIIGIMGLIILWQRRSLKTYKEKVGRLEEGIMDPMDHNRGSSNLTETGTTNPEDLP